MSWAIFWNDSLGACLDYYIDFHHALLPHAERAFKARFEDVTRDFGGLVHKFNQRFGTHYHAPEQDSEAVFSLIRAETDWKDSELDRRRVCCPSPERARMKALLMKDLARSGKIARSLEKARKLDHAITSGDRLNSKPALAPDTRQLPV